MTGIKKIALGILLLTAISAAVELVVGLLHLPKSTTASAVGVFVGMGVALGWFSRKRKQAGCN